MNYSNCFLSEINSNKENIFIDYFSINTSQSKSIKSIKSINQTSNNDKNKENNIEDHEKIGISQENQGETVIFIENSEKTQIKTIFFYVNHLIFFNFSSFDLKNFTRLRNEHKNLESKTKIKIFFLNSTLFLLFLIKKPVFSVFLISIQTSSSLDFYYIKKELCSFSSFLYKDLFNIDINLNNDQSYTVSLLIILKNTSLKTVFFTFEYLFNKENESSQVEDLTIKLVSSSFQDKEDEDEEDEDNLIVNYPYIIKKHNNESSIIYKYNQETESKSEITRIYLLDKETLLNIHQFKTDIYYFSSLEVKVTNPNKTLYKSLEIKIYKYKTLSQIIELDYKIQYNLLLNKEYSIKLIKETGNSNDYVYLTVHIHTIGVYLHRLFIDNSKQDTDPCLVLERIYYIDGNSILTDVFSIENDSFLYYDMEKTSFFSLDIVNSEYLDCLILQTNTNLMEKFIENLDFITNSWKEPDKTEKTEYLDMISHENKAEIEKVFEKCYFQFEKKAFQTELLINKIEKQFLNEKERNNKVFNEISMILSGLVERKEGFLSKKRRKIIRKMKEKQEK